MNKQQRIEKLTQLTGQFRTMISDGRMDLTSEQTARSWIERLFEIFDWDCADPNQVDQEVNLSALAQANLHLIDSTHRRPDYLFCLGNRELIYIDAKKISENLFNNKHHSFQIRSYGWSASHPCAIMTNFKQLVIYDCRYKPHKDDVSTIGRVFEATFEEFVEKYDQLEAHLLKENVQNGKLNDKYNIYNLSRGQMPLDLDFAEHIRSWRLKFANSFLSCDGELSENQVSFLTQVLLDRLLFLRVAGGLSIEKEEILKELSAHSKGSWKSIVRFFKDHCFQKYGGDLFGNKNFFNGFIISDELLTEFIETLYFPYPYRFDVITPVIIGHIYERYLGRKLVKKAGKITDEFKEEYQKTRGAVYTPHYIVRNVVENTLDPLTLGKKLEDILKISIIDPSCGSGSFLIGTFDYLTERVIDSYRAEKLANKRQTWFWQNPRNGKIHLKVQAKRYLLSKCIFGVDIDPQAVEIAKLSLSLKTLENSQIEPSISMEMALLEPRILEGVGTNIKTGNTLVDSRIFSFAPTLRNNLQEVIKLKPFDWHNEKGFFEVMERGGFDCVVGNPPYIEIKHYKKALPSMHEYLTSSGDYESCGSGKTDIAMPFIERSLSILKPTGRLGFIIQNRFFKSEYGRNSRTMLARNRTIETIIDFGSLKVFPDRTTYTCILILNKKSSKKIKYNKVMALDHIDQRMDWSNNAFPSLKLELANNLNGETWFFCHPDLLALRSKLIRAFGTFKNHEENVSVSVGLQLLFKKVYYIKGRSQNGIVTGKNLLGEDVEIERTATRPFVINRFFYPFKRLLENDFVLFPYRISNGQVERLQYPVFNKAFPLAGQYLKNNQTLIKEKVATLAGDSWNLYTYEKNLVEQSFPKVLIPSTVSSTVATIDIDGSFYQDNVRINAVQVRNASPEVYGTICGIINSTVFDCMAKITAEILDNGYIQLNKQFLDPVPFPYERIISNVTLQNKMSHAVKDLSDSIAKYVELSDFEAKIAQETLIERKYEEMDKLVSEEVYQLSKADLVTLKQFSSRDPILKLIKMGCEASNIDEEDD